MAIYAISAACTGCKACPPVCPTESIFFGGGYGGGTEKVQFVIDADGCNGCTICVQVCPVDAIHPRPEPTLDKANR